VHEVLFIGINVSVLRHLQLAGAILVIARIDTKRRKRMLTVTSPAIAAIKEHMRQHSIDAAVRITMMGGGCAGENLRFTLCEMQPNDLSFTFDGLIFLLDRELAAQCGAITVNFAAEYDHCPCSGRNGGFSISSERCSFRCCRSSLQTDQSHCWESCPTSCSNRFSETYDNAEALQPAV
jgi:Fe-S cluster assembly iron-binding protein IscA